MGTCLVTPLSDPHPRAPAPTLKEQLTPYFALQNVECQGNSNEWRKNENVRKPPSSHLNLQSSLLCSSSKPEEQRGPLLLILQRDSQFYLESRTSNSEILLSPQLLPSFFCILALFLPSPILTHINIFKEKTKILLTFWCTYLYHLSFKE